MELTEVTAAGAVRAGAGARAARALALAAALLAPALARAEGEAADPAWRVGAQVTAAGFFVPRFHSPYANPALSFGPGPDTGWSLVTTLFGGARLWPGAVAVIEPEFADGAGAPNVSGIAGYLDGNIIRVAKVGVEPYVARAFLHQDLALGPAPAADADGDEGAEEPEEPFGAAGPSALGRPRPASRLELTAGKFATTDFFDVASASSDPRHRFMNWSLMTNGAWDYAADTRGYTWGAVVALEQPRWAVRAAVTLMPTTPNGSIFDGDVAHARSEMAEVEVRYRALGQGGAVKLLGFVNHARAGKYADALAAAGPGEAPRLGPVERVGAVKYGLGLLVDQRLGPAAAFLRLSWNDGATETFAFTEIDRAVSAGVDLPTRGFGRADDHLGLGVAVNGLSPDHHRYLAAGGQGFQLGDGRLSYAAETVIEGYYGLRLMRYVELTGDVQAIVNPGMNADRGPAVAFGVRLHAHL